MGRIRVSTIVLGVAFALFATVLVTLRETLRLAHIDESILKVASDASIYFEVFELLYADADLIESPALFLVGSPMLFMKLAGGNLFIVQACNLALMLVTLRVALVGLGTLSGRLFFVAGALCFPYFLFGFLGLNKEIYAMCSAIFFGSYLIRGRRSHLLYALLLAACARYYMLIALLVLFFTVPREGRPRYGLVVAVLLAFSAVAPVAKYIVPEYTTEGLLEDSGTIGIVFAWLIDHFAYALTYPIKYAFLIPTRAYGYLVGASEDLMGAVVSALSVLMFLAACLAMLNHRRLDPLAKRLIVAGFVAPAPIMWSEIMHWRYYSFVYFFFLFALLLQRERGRRPAPATPGASQHAASEVQAR